MNMTNICSLSIRILGWENLGSQAVVGESKEVCLHIRGMKSYTRTPIMKYGDTLFLCKHAVHSLSLSVGVRRNILQLKVELTMPELHIKSNVSS